MPTRPPRPVTSLWKRKDKRGLWTEFQYDPAGNATNVVTTGNLTGEPGVQSAAHIAFYNSKIFPCSKTHEVRSQPLTIGRAMVRPGTQKMFSIPIVSINGFTLVTAPAIW